MRTFDPWRGDRYQEGFRGVRLLIVGEAHYGRVGEERSTVTREVVEYFVSMRGRARWFRFFSTTQRLVCGGRGWLSGEERMNFWHRVAFYNYIQSYPDEKPRVRPRPEMWAAAREPFLQTLSELAPQLVLVLGSELSRNLPALPTWVIRCSVQHPSSGRFRYAEWQPGVQKALEAIKSDREPQLPPAIGGDAAAD